MGITLHGVIERCQGLQHGPGVWFKLAEVEFEKDYPLMRAIHEMGKEGCPPNPSYEVAKLAESWRMHWVDGRTFLDLKEWMAEPDYEDSELDLPTAQHRATEAFVKAFAEGEGRPEDYLKTHIRIVFYEI